MIKLKTSVNCLKFTQIFVLVFTTSTLFYLYLNINELSSYLSQDVEAESSSAFVSNSIEGNQNFEDIRLSLYSLREREAIQQIKNELRASHNDELITDLKADVKKKYESILKDELVQEFENEILNRSEIDPTYREKYFDEIINTLHNHKPAGVTVSVKERPLTYFRYKWIIPMGSYTIDFLSSILDTDNSKIEKIKSKHKSVASEIKKLNFPEKVFKGNGIIINGGGAYFPNSIIAIRNLREIGSELPIELIIDDEQQYDETICESLLPKLNTKCIIISHVLGKSNYDKLQLTGYELKMVGLFVSSFENVIMLDSDNLPVKNPDYLFVSRPFLAYKCIMWPDLWHRATAPSYYEVTDTKIGEPVRKSFSKPWSKWRSRDETVLADLEGSIPDTTIELGELVLSKREHYKPLLLAMYYNLNGNSMYYNLLCQGTYGEGDKETMIAAFHYFKNEYYLVNHIPQRLGLSKGSMIQYDPEQDYDYYAFIYKYFQDNDLDTRTNIGMYDDKLQEILQGIRDINPYPEPEMFAIHAQRPKINPVKNAFNPKDYMTYGYESRKMGYYEDEYKAFFQSNDHELRFYRYSQWFACEADLGEEYWKEKHKHMVCERVKKHVQFLVDTSNTPEMQNLKDLGV